MPEGFHQVAFSREDRVLTAGPLVSVMDEDDAILTYSGPLGHYDALTAPLFEGPVRRPGQVYDPSSGRRTHTYAWSSTTAEDVDVPFRTHTGGFIRLLMSQVESRVPGDRDDICRIGVVHVEYDGRSASPSSVSRPDPYRQGVDDRVGASSFPQAHAMGVGTPRSRLEP